LLETTHDRALSIDGGTMWFTAFAFGLWHNLRLGGATRRKWRLPDGRVSEWAVFMFGVLKVVAPTYVN
jgi:hypothetical protein